MDAQSIFQRLQAGENASEIRFVPEGIWLQVGSYFRTPIHDVVSRFADIPAFNHSAIS
jgi:hypothetical protein